MQLRHQAGAGARAHPAGLPLSGRASRPLAARRSGLRHPRASKGSPGGGFRLFDLFRGGSAEDDGSSSAEGAEGRAVTPAQATPYPPPEGGQELAEVPVPASARIPTASELRSIRTPEDAWSPPVGGGKVDDLQRERLGTPQPVPDHDGTECLKWDATLWSHAEHFRYRWNLFKSVRKAIDENEGGLENFSRGYERFGLNRGVDAEGRPGIWYREWAPEAKALALVGEFNGWEPKDQHWAFKNTFGIWELFLPDAPSATGGGGLVPAISHRSKVKARLETASGEWVDRIPAWIRWATQQPGGGAFEGVHWDPARGGLLGVPGGPGAPPGTEGSTAETHETREYEWRNPRPPRPRDLRIYECHVGMSSQEPKISSYLEFARDVLPRIRKAGYNALQIMAVQEHAYYGSFGYHVTNFFAVSSRCGTPDELKALIDEAHGLGLVVLMDVVHSHASKNVQDGINEWDGSPGGYFHAGPRGYHWMWDSRCFDYGKWETLRFLLSNARYWVEELRFDGFRFDGVTSMMYHHHGLQTTFSGDYNEYFGLATDVDAVVYLMLVNSLLHDLWPETAITIGEDVSGMPTFARPWTEGGVGFDYRLNMAVADKWIELLEKHTDDASWDIGSIAHTLTNRRYAEACVGYAESHDQALVGDKTIAFWLMDSSMYTGMSLLSGGEDTRVSRGIGLHKMIRLVTAALGGESYLNFMGNEFGHPEWIDFPRTDSIDTSTGAFIPGNGGSLDKCRRRWDLADDPTLRYQQLLAFDRAFNHLDKAFGFIPARHQWISRKDESDKILVFERGDLVFVFNWHPTRSFSDYRVGTSSPGPYKVVLSTDERVFGGFQNVTAEADVEFHTQEILHDKRPHSMLVYAPSRTAVVYAPARFVDSTAGKEDSLLKWSIPGLAVRGLGPYFDR